MEDNFDVSGFVSDIIKVALKKDKKRIADKKYYENNTEKKKEYAKQYNQTLEGKISAQKWRKSHGGKKSKRINQWKRQGIITDDYDALYNHYLRTSYCDACRVELTYDRYPTATTKVVDHDHSITDAPNFRNILCNSCNVKRK
jgi:hypothetical protein